MSFPANVRRNTHGSIDFDHYRRAATRERTIAISHAFGRCADAVGRALGLASVRLKRACSLPTSRTLTGRPSR